VTALCISQPENFLFKRPDDDVEIKIIDFGLSRFEEANSAMTTRVGTPYYIGETAAVRHSTFVSLVSATSSQAKALMNSVL
jgi:hypothetical protein